MIIYPNPSAGNFIIEKENIENGKIEIFDLFGKLISSNDFNKRKEIDISDFAKGMYLVKVYDAQSGYTRKIVVE